MSITEFKTINDVELRQICKRYHPVLKLAQVESITIREFESKISGAVKEYLDWKCKLSEKKLKEHYMEHKNFNNRKHDIERAVIKYKGYCSRNSLKKVSKT